MGAWLPCPTSSPRRTLPGSTQEAQKLVGLETAAAVRDFLRHGIVRNAVNFPSIAPEDFKRLQPFVTLAERLGLFLGQLADGRPEAVGIRYYGDLTEGNSELLVGATLVGLFKSVLSSTVTPDQRTCHCGSARSGSHRVAELAAPDLYEPAVRGSSTRAKVSAGSKARCSSMGSSMGARGLFSSTAWRSRPPSKEYLWLSATTISPASSARSGQSSGATASTLPHLFLDAGPAGAVGVVNVDQGLPGTGPDQREIDEALLTEIRAVPAVQQADLVKL